MAHQHPNRATFTAHSGKILGALAATLGVPHSALASGVSQAQVAAYLGGRSDVSTEVQQRISARLVQLAVGAPDDEWRQLAPTAGELIRGRLGAYERLTNHIFAVTDGFPACAEARLPWAWLAVIELALLLAATPKEQSTQIAPATLAYRGFGSWLRAQIQLLNFEASAGTLAQRCHATPDTAEFARYRRLFARRLDGDLPRTLEDRRLLIQALAGTDRWTEHAQVITRGTVRALAAARAAKLCDEHVPGYGPQVAEDFRELLQALEGWSADLDTRQKVIAGGLVVPEGAAALAVAAPSLAEGPFRSMVIAASRGFDHLERHLAGAYDWLSITTHRFGAGDDAREARYASLLNPNAADFLCLLLVDDSMPAEARRRACLDAAALLAWYEGDGPKAASFLLQRCRHSQPLTRETQFYIASMLWKVGEQDQANALLDAAMASDESLSSTGLAIAVLALKAAERDVIAWLECERSKHLDPGRPSPHALLLYVAAAREEAGDLQGALDAFLEVATGKPGYSERNVTAIRKDVHTPPPAWCAARAAAVAEALGAKAVSPCAARFRAIAKWLRS